MPLNDLILACLTYFAVKHAIADFFLQTRYQFSNKGRYGHPGGLLHAGIHSVFSLPALAILPPPTLSYGLAVLAAEFVVHYHCDWTKEQAVKRLKLGFTDNGFWRAMGLDQLVHALTYIAMVKALAG